MTPIETRLLTILLAETRRIEADDVNHHEFGTDARVRCAVEKDDLAEGLGIRIGGGWIGEDPVSRQARRRVLLSLKSAGLVELGCRWNEKTTHAKLTAQGRTLAESLDVEHVTNPGDAQ